MFVRFTKQLMQQEYSHSADETPDLGNRPTASVSRLTKRQSVRVDMMGSWGCMHAGGKRGGTTQINWRVGEWRRRARRERDCNPVGPRPGVGTSLRRDRGRCSRCA